MFLVDANVLIEAKNRYYAFDIAPGFWNWLDRTHQHGQACSITAVYEEIIQGDDELSNWAKSHKDFFYPVDQRTAYYFTELSKWATSQSFTQAALSAFTSTAADYLLVAFGKAYGCTVVTLETSDPRSRKRIKIPDACNAMDVEWCNPFEMFRNTGATLQLAP